MAETDHKNTICLVDGSGYIFRAFYALPMMTRPDGTPVNAVYGFLKMLMQLVQEQHCAHIIVVFDAARRNFRNDIYPAYKQTRREVPAELIPQFPLIREACRALNVPQIEMEGFEADDLIATYTRIARDKNWQVRIVSADKDLMQLMQPNVQLYDPMKHKALTPEDVFSKFGVTPDKVIDVQALMGDSTDNVPGATGIGPKTAAELINQFGSLKNVYAHLSEIKSEKRREGLERDKEQVFISKQLVRLDTDVPLNDDLTRFRVQIPNETILIDFLNKNNFKSLLSKTQGWLKMQTDFLKTAPQADELPLFGTQTSASTDLQKQTDLTKSAILQKNTDSLNASPALLEIPPIQIIQNKADFEKYLPEIYAEKEIAFSCFEGNNMLSGLSLLNKRRAFYIILSPENDAYEPDLFAAPKQNGVPIKNVLEQLIQLFADKTVHKIGFDIKKQLHILSKSGCSITDIQNYDDVFLQNYVLNGSMQEQTLSVLAQQFIDFQWDTLSVTHQKKGALPLELPLKQLAEIHLAETFAIYRLYTYFKEQLAQKNKTEVYQKIDLPLIPVLFKMEKAGILIDKKQLEYLNLEFTQKLNQLVNQIYECAGMEFNVNSPAQIASVLFEKMGLNRGKKNKSGSFSTNVKVLEKLAEEGVEIASLILKYRLFGKLKSTYIDALLHLADKKGRVHTTFLQTIANTGRLSSVDPNLQNIPIRTEAGKEIRRAFIARPGYKIVCADYSQIELRLMADVANVSQLKQSFINNEDIHARTASQIFKIPLAQIDSDTRRKAKAINFGIIYGISPFGLANQLGISRAAAKDYIDAYFKHYPEIKVYMEKTEAFLKQHDYVETPFGRTCYIAGIENPKTHSFAVRAAINAPIQGGAADIIKLAMKEIDKTLALNNWDAALLLQVHDELVFEVKEKDVAAVMQMVKDKMENAVSLSIPLVADVRAAENWKDAH